MKIFNSKDLKLAKFAKQEDFRYYDIGELVGILFKLLKKAKQPIVINGGSYSYAADVKKNPLLWKSSDGAVINIEYFSDIFQYLSDYIIEDILLSAVNDEVSHYIKSGKLPSQEKHEFENITELVRKTVKEALNPFGHSHENDPPSPWQVDKDNPYGTGWHLVKIEDYRPETVGKKVFTKYALYKDISGWKCEYVYDSVNDHWELGRN